jgi:hypothetical protein
LARAWTNHAKNQQKEIGKIRIVIRREPESRLARYFVGGIFMGPQARRGRSVCNRRQDKTSKKEPTDEP